MPGAYTSSVARPHLLQACQLGAYPLVYTRSARCPQIFQMPCTISENMPSASNGTGIACKHRPSYQGALRCHLKRSCSSELKPAAAAATAAAVDRYQPEDGAALPLCATQYMLNNSAGQGQYTRVTPRSTDPLSKANAADLAHAWSKGVMRVATSHLQ